MVHFSECHNVPRLILARRKYLEKQVGNVLREWQEEHKRGTRAGVSQLSSRDTLGNCCTFQTRKQLLFAAFYLLLFKVSFQPT